MLAIQIGYGNGKSEEMVFPLDDAGKSKIDALREEAEGGNEELTIRSSRSSVQKLPSCINGMEFDRQSQKELEFLNERFGHLTRAEQDILSAMLEMEEPETLKEIINLSYNLSNYELLRDVSDSGRIAAELLSRDKKIEVPEELWSMLDFERIRERYFDTHQGAYGPSGLVLKCEEKEFTQVYDRFLPDPGYEKDGLFLVHLYRMSGNKPLHYTISLPAEEEKQSMAKQALGIRDFSECRMNQYGGSLDELKGYLPLAKDVESLNQFAKLLKEQVLADGLQNVNRLMAALEAECSRSMEDAAMVAKNLSRYQIMEEMKSPDAYARFKMEQDGSVFATSICRNYLDWYGLGEELLKRDGVMMTAHGLVTCEDWCCERLPDEVVVTRLYSPLAGTIEDEEEYSSTLPALSLPGYEYDIKKAIQGDYIQGVRSGLAEYMDHQLLKQRVISMFPTVESYQYKLWGVLEVKSWGKLQPEEWEFIKDQWAGQAADGWGEGFEQREIDCGEGVSLYVHFYTGEMRIHTEQELKRIAKEQPDMQMGGMA